MLEFVLIFAPVKQTSKQIPPEQYFHSRFVLIQKQKRITLMEYNTQRNKMIIPEYGRNIQKMIDQCIAIPDRDQRTRFAYLIVSVMGQMVPKGKESGDMKQKLWDHLFIISDFKLDVDSPYPPPRKDVLQAKPDPVPYSDEDFRYRHYGKNIERIIEKAAEYPEGPEKDALIKTIANHLKKSYLNWNRNSVDDELIMENLEELSKGKIKASTDLQLSHTSEILKSNKKKSTKPGQHTQRNGRKRQ